MRTSFERRYLDLLGSIYIYNEHRVYTAIDRVLEAVQVRWPSDEALIAKVRSHRSDERKHYLMFRRWFERRGAMPIAVGRTCGVTGPPWRFRMPLEKGAIRERWDH